MEYRYSLNLVGLGLEFITLNNGLHDRTSWIANVAITTTANITAIVAIMNYSGGDLLFFNLNLFLSQDITFNAHLLVWVFSSLLFFDFI